jgi:hypothetical protein
LLLPFIKKTGDGSGCVSLWNRLKPATFLDSQWTDIAINQLLLLQFYLGNHWEVISEIMGRSSAAVKMLYRKTFVAGFGLLPIIISTPTTETVNNESYLLNDDVYQGGIF